MMYLVLRTATCPEYRGQRKAIILSKDSLRKDDHVVKALGTIKEVHAWIDEHPGVTRVENIQRVEATYMIAEGIYYALASYGATERPRKSSRAERYIKRIWRAMMEPA